MAMMKKITAQRNMPASSWLLQDRPGLTPDFDLCPRRQRGPSQGLGDLGANRVQARRQIGGPAWERCMQELPGRILGGDRLAGPDSTTKKWSRLPRLAAGHSTQDR